MASFFEDADIEVVACTEAYAEGRAAGRLAGFGDGLALGVARGLQAGQRVGFLAAVAAAEAARTPLPLSPRAVTLVAMITASAAAFPLENLHSGAAASESAGADALDAGDTLESMAARTKALLSLCPAPALAPARLAAAADPVAATAQAARTAAGAQATQLVF